MATGGGSGTTDGKTVLVSKRSTEQLCRNEAPQAGMEAMCTTMISGASERMTEKDKEGGRKWVCTLITEKGSDSG